MPQVWRWGLRFCIYQAGPRTMQGGKGQANAVVLKVGTLDLLHQHHPRIVRNAHSQAPAQTRRIQSSGSGLQPSVF